jgi:hypothetical protein
MQPKVQKIIAISVLLLFGGLGTWLLVASHAATLSLSSEPENGTVSTPAAVVNDTTASGGKAVKFNAPPTPSGVPVTDGRYVVVTSLDAHKIFVLDPRGTWNTSAALWTWSAGDSPQIAAADKGWFQRPTEAKLIDNSQNLLVTSGGSGGGSGGVAIVRLSDKHVLFYAQAGLHTHTAEELPDGNLVTVSTTDYLVRVMSTDPAVSHFPSSVVHSDLGKADGIDLVHGAVWDPVSNRLWTVGNKYIIAYSYNFNRDHPVLTRDTSIPAVQLIDSFGGHDMYPVLGQRKLFVTANNHSNIFDLTTHVLTLYVPDAKTGLKAMSLNPSGQLVTNTLTSNVFFGTPGNPTLTTRPLNINQVYKARWWIETRL